MDDGTAIVRFSIEEGNTSIVRMDAYGRLIKAMRTTVRLYASKKHVYEMKGTWAVTAEGYRILNKYAGVQVLTPPNVMVDGMEKLNPCIMRSDDGQIDYVYVRKVALGRAPMGNLVPIDYTLYFSPSQMLARDLIERFKPYVPKNGVAKPAAAWGRLVRKDALADEDLADATKQFVPYGGGLYLEIDLNHPEVIGKIADHANMVLFADRRAQTMCERNCLKAHPAIAVSKVEVVNGIAEVQIITWPQADESLEALDTIMGNIAAGNPIDGVEVQRKRQEASHEDVAGTEGEEIVDADATVLDDDEDTPRQDDGRPLGDERAGSSPDTPGEEPAGGDVDTDFAALRAKLLMFPEKAQSAALKFVGIANIGQAKDDPEAMDKLRSVLADMEAGE